MSKDQWIVRGLEGEVVQALRLRAAQHGRSVEDGARSPAAA